MTLWRAWSGSPSVWTASSCSLTLLKWVSPKSSQRSSRPGGQEMHWLKFQALKPKLLDMMDDILVSDTPG